MTTQGCDILAVALGEIAKGSETMTEEEKRARKGGKRAEKREAEEIRQLARYEAIKKADLASEKAIEVTAKANEIKRTEKRAIEEDRQSARYEAIKRADLAREQALEKAKEAKKFKAKQ